MDNFDVMAKASQEAATKVSIEDYNAFVVKYDANTIREWYRFGQAFINEMVSGVTDPDVFYGNRAKAEKLIWERYIAV